MTSLALMKPRPLVIPGIAAVLAAPVRCAMPDREL